MSTDAPDVSADTSSAETAAPPDVRAYDPAGTRAHAPEAAPRPLPTPGEAFLGRTVRASGTLPVLGLEFVVFRHSARDQVAAMVAGRNLARGAGLVLPPSEGAPGPADLDPAGVAAMAAAALIAQASRFHRPGSAEWEWMVADDVLDLDAEDFEALNTAGAEGQAAPVPPSPSS